ncbi:MAG: HAD family hydrolase [Tannerella sp.]|jgi:putative hydrolase of the HAD superfamily|nr:HAD family hydrolase [Tannerella sp.]
MIHPEQIKGFLFDYGGTIDSDGVHWSEVIWQAYRAEQMPVTKEAFRQAYVHGERTLGKYPLVQPHHTFSDMLLLKTDIQLEWLKANRFLPEDGVTPERKQRIAEYGYACAGRSAKAARPVLEALAERYPLALVSNFYGNIASVLKDFELDRFFPVIIESAVCGVRKPDPQIFRLGVEALHLTAGEVAVVGDSYDKDILPAASIGCLTIWLKNTGWEASTGDETAANKIISCFKELETIMNYEL